MDTKILEGFDTKYRYAPSPLAYHAGVLFVSKAILELQANGASDDAIMDVISGYTALSASDRAYIEIEYNRRDRLANVGIQVDAVATS